MPISCRPRLPRDPPDALCRVQNEGSGRGRPSPSDPRTPSFRGLAEAGCSAPPLSRSRVVRGRQRRSRLPYRALAPDGQIFAGEAHHLQIAPGSQASHGSSCLPGPDAEMQAAAMVLQHQRHWYDLVARGGERDWSTSAPTRTSGMRLACPAVPAQPSAGSDPGSPRTHRAGKSGAAIGATVMSAGEAVSRRHLEPLLRQSVIGDGEGEFGQSSSASDR
jgi:hypothetical protein